MKINEKYLCIFGGGSVRGFSYIGVHKALKELGISVPVVAGSSIGAVYAAFVALNQNYDEIEQIFEKINFGTSSQLKNRKRAFPRSGSRRDSRRLTFPSGKQYSLPD